MAREGCFVSILWRYWDLPVSTFEIKNRKQLGWQEESDSFTVAALSLE